MIRAKRQWTKLAVVLAVACVGTMTRGDAASDEKAKNQAIEALVRTETARQLAEINKASREMNLAARAQGTASILQTLRSQLELYRIQHDDKTPATLDLLLKKTAADGTVVENGNLGPYLLSMPANPFTDSAVVVEEGKGTAETGWTYDAKSGVIKAVLPKSASAFEKGLGAKSIEWYDDAVAAPVADVSVPVTVDREVLEKLVREEVRRQAQELAQQMRVQDIQARLRSVESTVRTLRGQVALYKIQHDNKPPAELGLLGRKTDMAGNIVKAGGVGPYISGWPSNPLTGSSGVTTRAGATSGMGWIYEPETGKFTAVLPTILAPIAKEVSEFAELVDGNGPVNDSPRAEAHE